MSEEKKELIIKLWNEGKTGGEIAEVLGATRNSILGFVHRLRAKGHELKEREGRVTIRKEAKKPVKNDEFCVKINTDDVVSRYFRQPKRGKTLMFLDHSSCRFITSYDEENVAIYCGERVDKTSYCKHHASLCYQPPKKPNLYRVPV